MMPEVGARIRIKSVSLGKNDLEPGVGRLVAVILPSEQPEPEILAGYYGISATDPRMRVLGGTYMVERYVVQRSTGTFLVIPGMETFYHMCEVVDEGSGSSGDDGDRVAGRSRAASGRGPSPSR